MRCPHTGDYRSPPVLNLVRLQSTASVRRVQPFLGSQEPCCTRIMSVPLGAGNQDILPTGFVETFQPGGDDRLVMHWGHLLWRIV